MKSAPRVFELLATLLTYPADGYLAAAEECVDALESSHCDAEQQMLLFLDRLQPLQTSELQELFTITFDLNPVCTLEVGWHLHGDTYDRGEFLVRMRQLLRRCDVDERGELPDHLGHLIAALPHLDDEERRTLIATALLPAVEKMQPALAKSHNPFEHLMSTVFTLLDDEAWPHGRPSSAPAVGA